MKKFSYLLMLMMALTACNDQPKNDEIADNIKTEKPEPAIINEYGFILNDYEVVRDTIRNGDSFGVILGTHGVDPNKIFEIVNKVRDTLNPRRIVVGKPYVILKERDSAQTPKAFIYENDLVNYTVVDLRDSINAYTAKKPVTITKKTVAGMINSSLSEAMEDAGLNYLLAHEMSNIYQWSIDFFRLQKGDRFKLVYNEKYINDTIYAGIENIEAAVFYHEDKPYYAFNFMVDSVAGSRDYYDEKARPLQSFFLKAPLDFFRISSRFSPNRFHPVQKRWKAHKGTDYAAAHGTPIKSTANGVVIASSYTAGNGNYVKIKHNDTYTTQYLHMSKRAVRQGERVKQGEVIGYVGSTGLATGPHVCYRFWKNGVQVDPFRQNLPSAEPIEDKYIPSYFATIEPLKDELGQIEFKESI
ncbi:Murein DD-endopeptidase MepM and murein hydrolase activator NlpD, contain LysM domain [Salinimicrobium sediminis]|uniref:Murein DD-endopeptidase MepM and murein hydrolase activator NlpD, contain LysM domain n=1 Tax=Salinimicrobium sediminis TaxID=1343891 RepID=A0A285X1F6_9FLAO|nr:peptidoglycan DD-metalloendopeptidase family protein [Salinimicrobium sediminis]SOC79152.1 Murein DD-endopeptidase MepM and murein hydrolase activator NlpD, contain LysM domain [Salinimicrobium sediminis]